MDKLKDRMYNFEVTPPTDIWQNISAEMDGHGVVVPITKAKKNNKNMFYLLAAAACVTGLIFSGIWVMQSNRNEKTPVSSTAINKNQNIVSTQKLDTDNKIKVPHVTEKTANLNKKPATDLVRNNPVKHANKPDSTPVIKNDDIAADESKTYITVAGPEGQPVKVSSKVASLIESSDNSYPPKPVWNKKINKWKDIMKANTLTPTTGNFLDIVDLTNSLKEK